MKYSFIISLLLFCQSRGNDNSSILTINSESRNETIISIDSQTHIDYGLSYPITYEFNIPSESYNLRSYRKFQSNQDWSQIVENTSEDFFNGIEAVRVDYNDNMFKKFLSAYFVIKTFVASSSPLKYSNVAFFTSSNTYVFIPILLLLI